MKHQRTRYGFVVRLDPGEEIIATLREFAAAERIGCGLISGLGAVGDPELGYYARRTGEYVRQVVAGEFEILSLTGNVSELEGTPFPHCHIVIGDDAFGARGGHLFRGTVTVTCEVQIVSDPRTLLRVRVPGSAFSPLEPAEG
jgi:predicted DNA-binding protein with PD1-like motif